MTFEGAAEVGTAITAAGGFEIAGGTLAGAGSLTLVGGGGTVAWNTGSLSTTLNVGLGARLRPARRGAIAAGEVRRHHI